MASFPWEDRYSGSPASPVRSPGSSMPPLEASFWLRSGLTSRQVTSNDGAPGSAVARVDDRSLSRVRAGGDYHHLPTPARLLHLALYFHVHGTHDSDHYTSHLVARAGFRQQLARRI